MTTAATPEARVPANDPEPTVTVLVEPEVWDSRDNILCCGYKVSAPLNDVLRALPLTDVALLSDHGNPGRFPFMVRRARAAGIAAPAPCAISVSTTHRDPETGETVAVDTVDPWLAWAHRQPRRSGT